jgi:hypothetical protein
VPCAFSPRDRCPSARITRSAPRRTSIAAIHPAGSRGVRRFEVGPDGLQAARLVIVAKPIAVPRTFSG